MKPIGKLYNAEWEREMMKQNQPYSGELSLQYSPST